MHPGTADGAIFPWAESVVAQDQDIPRTPKDYEKNMADRSPITYPKTSEPIVSLFFKFYADTNLVFQFISTSSS
jgi:hypothetical protein